MATMTVTTNVGTETVSANETSTLSPAGAGSRGTLQQLPSILCQADSRTTEAAGGVRVRGSTTATETAPGSTPGDQGGVVRHGGRGGLHHVTTCVDGGKEGAQMEEEDDQTGEGEEEEKDGKEEAEAEQPLRTHSGAPENDKHEQVPDSENSIVAAAGGVPDQPLVEGKEEEDQGAGDRRLSWTSAHARSRLAGDCGYEADADGADDDADSSTDDDSELGENLDGHDDEKEDAFVDAHTHSTPCTQHFDHTHTHHADADADTHEDDCEDEYYEDAHEDVDALEKMMTMMSSSSSSSPPPPPSSPSANHAVQEALDALEGRSRGRHAGGATTRSSSRTSATRKEVAADGGGGSLSSNETARLITAAAAASGVVLLHRSGRAAEGRRSAAVAAAAAAAAPVPTIKAGKRDRRISSQETLCNWDDQGGGPSTLATHLEDTTDPENNNSNNNSSRRRETNARYSKNNNTTTTTNHCPSVTSNSNLRRSMSAPISSMRRSQPGAAVVGGIQIQTRGLAGGSPTPPPRYLPDYAAPSPRSYSLWQPAFPQVFDIFDYGDGQCYYLGGGGRRLTRHLSRYRRRDTMDVSNNLSAWPYEHPPLYACRLHQLPRRSGLPPLVLYGGPDADADGAWADVKFGMLGRGMTVGLPPVAPGGFPAWSDESLEEEKYGDAGDDYDARVDEKVSVHYGWHTRFRFEVEVGPRSAGAAYSNNNSNNNNNNNNVKMRREAFEWRYCSGESLEALSGKRWPTTPRGGEAAASKKKNKKNNTKSGTDNNASSRRMAPATSMGAAAKALAPATAGLARHVSLKRGFSFRRQEDNIRLPGGRKKGSCRWSGGWQLVRLHDDIPLESSSRPTSMATTTYLDQLIIDEAALASERQRTSDGHEIVATWANVSSTWKASRRKNHPYRTGRESSAYMATTTTTTTTTNSVARFSFLGSGKSGQLGERWALMAVVSGLAVWERDRRQRRRRQQTVMEACGGFANIA